MKTCTCGCTHFTVRGKGALKVWYCDHCGTHHRVREETEKTKKDEWTQ